MPIKETNSRPHLITINKHTNQQNTMKVTLSAFLVLISTYGTAFAQNYPASVPLSATPNGCSMYGDGGDVDPTNSGKPQKFRAAYGHCGVAPTAWLFQMPPDEKSEKVILLDTLSLTHIKKSERFEAVECFVGKKKIYANAFAHGKWANRDAYDIKAGSGLIRVWVPNADQKRFVEVPITGMTCSRDLP